MVLHASPAVQQGVQSAQHSNECVLSHNCFRRSPRWCSSDQLQPAVALAVSCGTKQTQWLQRQLGPGQPCRQAVPPVWHHHRQRQRQQLQQQTCLLSSAAAAATGGRNQRRLAVQGIPMVAAVAEGATHAAHLQEQAQHQQNKPWQGAMPCAAAVDQQLPVVANSSVYPRLLPTYPDTVDSCQQQLCEVLLIAPAEAQLLMLNSTEAAALPRQQLEANWAQLQRLLPVSRQQLLQAMLQLPDLLLQPQQVVSIRLAEAAEVLQIPLTQLQRQQKPTTPQLHWRLLLLSPQELEERLVQLLQLLDLQEQQQKQQQRRPEQAEQLSRKLRQAVVLMLVQEPRLLSVEQAQLVSSVEALEQACSWPLLRLLPGLRSHPRLLVTPAEQLYAGAAALQQQLRLSEEGLALALRRAPAALLVSEWQLADVLADLASSLGVATDVAADILLQEPQLLLRRPGAVTAVLGVLRSTFQLNNDELLQVVEYDPTVLCCSPGGLADSSSKFKEAASRHKPWAAEYKQLMSRPVNVARALRIEPLRLLRLTYLTRMRKAASSSLKAAVSMSGRQFVGLYPSYAAWLAKHYSAGGVPRQYRGNELDEDEDEDEY